MAIELRLNVGSDTDIQAIGLRDNRTNAYINDATVTFTLRVYDASVVNTSSEGSEAVFGSQEDVAMAYQTGSNGHYIGILPDTVTLVPGTRYWVDITVAASGDRDLRIRKLAIAKFAGTE